MTVKQFVKQTTAASSVPLKVRGRTAQMLARMINDGLRR